MTDIALTPKEYIERDYDRIRESWKKGTVEALLNDLHYVNFVEEFHTLFNTDNPRITPEILAMLDSKVSPYNFLYDRYMDDSAVGPNYDHDAMLDFLEQVFEHESEAAEADSEWV